MVSLRSAFDVCAAPSSHAHPGTVRFRGYRKVSALRRGGSFRGTSRHRPRRCQSMRRPHVSPLRRHRRHPRGVDHAEAFPASAVSRFDGHRVAKRLGQLLYLVWRCDRVGNSGDCWDAMPLRITPRSDLVAHCHDCLGLGDQPRSARHHWLRPRTLSSPTRTRTPDGSPPPSTPWRSAGPSAD